MFKEGQFKPQMWWPGRGHRQQAEGGEEFQWYGFTCRTKELHKPEIWGSKEVCGSLHYLEYCLLSEKFQNKAVLDQADYASPSMNLMATEGFGNFPTTLLLLAYRWSRSIGQGVRSTSPLILIPACLFPFAKFAEWLGCYSSMDPDTPGVWLI